MSAAAPLPIESAQNPRFKLWRALLESRGIKKHGRFLLAGRKSVPEALARHPDLFEAVLARDPAQLAGLALPSAIEPFVLAGALFDELDVAGTGVPLLVGLAPALPAADLAAPPRGLELVCALGDPDNLGALLRSAAAFGASRVILLREAAHPFHPKCLRAGANAQFELELCQGPDWQALATAAGPLLALDGGGEDLGGFAWPQDLRLVLGEEGQGVPAALPARRLSIPTSGRVESLNATVAASVALYDWYRSRR